MKIYTKCGDKGMTTLSDGTRIAKNDERVDACGDIDELNSCLGLLVSVMDETHDSEFVVHVQRRLFYLGLSLSGTTLKTDSIDGKDVETVEKEIDAICALLPTIHSFTIPGGCKAAAQCHVCRTVCRRVERNIVALSLKCEVDNELLRFLNRLSDYLFVLSRKLNFIAGTPEKTFSFSCR